VAAVAYERKNVMPELVLGQAGASSIFTSIAVVMDMQLAFTRLKTTETFVQSYDKKCFPSDRYLRRHENWHSAGTVRSACHCEHIEFDGAHALLSYHSGANNAPPDRLDMHMGDQT
jgi:hypothetical protein